jgi:membrane-associated phospholipid phosphatase
LLGLLCDDACWRSQTAEWGGRSLRAILSGGPAVLLLESGLGGSRPGERPEASHWKPFDDWNGASGHAFIGAIPLLTAARMTDDRWLQGGLLFASLLPAWSRVNDNRHYLSQVGVGWWVAYLACEAVDRTEHADDRLTWAPILSPEMAGIAMVVRR